MRGIGIKCLAGAGCAAHCLNLAGVNLTQAHRYHVIVTGVNLDGATLRSANPIFVDLSYRNFASDDLTDINFTQATLSGANPEGANLSNANLDNAPLYGANLRGANLTHANFRDANIRDWILNSTVFLAEICPDGSRSWEPIKDVVVTVALSR